MLGADADSEDHEWSQSTASHTMPCIVMKNYPQIEIVEGGVLHAFCPGLTLSASTEIRGVG